MEQVVVVDPDGSCTELVTDDNGGVDVRRVDGSSKTICAVVAYSDCVVDGLELGDGANGSENFFLHNLHVFADVAEDGGLDEVAFVAVALAADFDLGSLFLTLFDITWQRVSYASLSGC